MKKFLLLLLLTALAVTGYFYFRGSGDNNVTVDTTTVVMGDLVRAVSATGTLEAVNTVNIGTQVSGTIEKIYVDYNSVVKKGDLLAEIDRSLLSARVRQSRANVLAAEANVQEAQANVKNLKKTRDRNRVLFERDLIAESELDSAQTSYETALAKLSSARAALAQRRADLEYDETTLGYTRITSPIDGVVTDRAIDEGQTVNASQTAPTLFTVAEDLTRMQVEAGIDEADIGQVKDGQAVEFTVDAYPDLSFAGEVDEIRLAPNIESNVVTYTVIVRVHNPELKLMPGMTANISVISQKRENVLKVNSAALRFQPQIEQAEQVVTTEVKKTGQGKGRRKADSQDSETGSKGTLWTYEDGELSSIQVTTGISDGMYTEVSGEVSEGLAVVTSMTGLADSGGGGSFFGFGSR